VAAPYSRVCCGCACQVAIKQIKRHFATWDECLGLREVASLSKLKHENIVRLKELVHEGGMLWFVFEFVPTNLYKRIQDSTVVFDDRRIRVVMCVLQPQSQLRKLTCHRSGLTPTVLVGCSYRRQLLEGLHYMHKHGFFHRDVKPEKYVPPLA